MALGTALAKALGLRKGGRDKPSIRLKAPDTGGRSFHFKHMTVIRGQSYKATKQAKGGGSTKGLGTAGAHLAYIERETAVEKLRAIEARAYVRELNPAAIAAQTDLAMPRKRGRPTLEEAKLREALEIQCSRLAEYVQEIGLENGIEADRQLGSNRTAVRGLEIENDPDAFERALEGEGRGAAAQTYIENPTKMQNGELILSSFGTIGETYDERLRFWQLVEEHERAPDARIQNRLICELPHQATAEARKEILERFMKPFREKGIPYHVAIHAPGTKNDSRNYHAHVVFNERPARRMKDPESGLEEWDFAIARTFKSASRNTRTNHPYRQCKDRDLNKKTFVIDMRKRFAACVNEVMASIDRNVRFDHRSYKDMGLGVAPVGNIKRVHHDRMNDGRLVIQDVHWTRRMIDAKLREAALARDPDVVAFERTSKALDAMKRSWPDLASINAQLEPRSRLTSLGVMPKRTSLQIINERKALEHAALENRLLAKAELAVCREVMEATRPPKLKGPRRVDLRTPEEQEEIRVLFDVAREEYDAITARTKREANRVKGLVALNKKAWREIARVLDVKSATPRASESSDPRTGKAMLNSKLAARSAALATPPLAAAVGRREYGAKAPATSRAPRAGAAAPSPPAGRVPTAKTRTSQAPAPSRTPFLLPGMAGWVPTAAPQAQRVDAERTTARATATRDAPPTGEIGSATSTARATEAAAKAKASLPSDHADTAFKAIVQATMDALVKSVITDISESGFQPFDRKAYWERAALEPPSVEALSRVELIMGMAPGTLGARPEASAFKPAENAAAAEPVPAAEAVRPITAEIKQEAHACKSAPAPTAPETSPATPRDDSKRRKPSPSELIPETSPPAVSRKWPVEPTFVVLSEGSVADIVENGATPTRAQREFTISPCQGKPRSAHINAQLAPSKKGEYDTPSSKKPVLPNAIITSAIASGELAGAVRTKAPTPSSEPSKADQTENTCSAKDAPESMDDRSDDQRKKRRKRADARRIFMQRRGGQGR